MKGAETSNKGIALDPDNPEWSEDEISNARAASKALPEIMGDANAKALINKRVGRPPTDNPKERITIRLDADVVHWVKQQGPGYQTRINSILRDAMDNQ